MMAYVFDFIHIIHLPVAFVSSFLYLYTVYCNTMAKLLIEEAALKF